MTKQVLLDTSFILTAVRQKIDFFYELKMQGFKILIPEKVLAEIKSIAKSKRGGVREESNLALQILNLHNFEKIKTSGKNADNAIINFSKKNPDVFIATLDREIKSKVFGHKVVIQSKKNIEVL